LKNCMVNVENSGYGRLQTAVGATVNSHTGEVNFEDLLKASEAKAHIVAAMSRIPAEELEQQSTTLHRQTFMDQKLSNVTWRKLVARLPFRDPDSELQEVLAARMIAHVIARWQYMYPLPEKPTLLAHLGSAKTMLNESFQYWKGFAPGNELSCPLATKDHESWAPGLDMRSLVPSTRITWILGSDESRLEETIGPLEDLDVHRYLVFRAVEQFLRSDIRSRYTPDPKPEDTDSNTSNFDKSNYKSSSATAEFDSSKSDSPGFNEPRSDMHGFPSNEFDDIFVSTLTTDLPSHDGPNPVIPTSNKLSSGSSQPNSPQINSTARTRKSGLSPLTNNPVDTMMSIPPRRMFKQSEAFASRSEPTPTPAPSTPFQVRWIVDNTSKPYGRNARREEGSNEQADERINGRENNEGRVTWYPAK
jgi:hypothetical protein